jgi:hypothetical protein
MRKVLGTYEKPIVERLQDGGVRYLFSIISATVAIFVVYFGLNALVDGLNFIDVNSAGTGGLTHDNELLVYVRYTLCGLAALFCFKKVS